jgi:hypothetical protein
MARALSAAPPNIAKAAKVVDLDDKGNLGTPVKEPPQHDRVAGRPEDDGVMGRTEAARNLGHVGRYTLPSSRSCCTTPNSPQ